MNRALIITGILPVSQIEHKKNENDILIVAEDKIREKDPSISFKYIFIFPFANSFLARISPKWHSYYKLKKQSYFKLKDRKLSLFPVFLLPKKLFFRNFLVRLSMFKYKKRLETIINDFKPTIIHAQDVDTSAYIAKKMSKKYNIPYVLTLRGVGVISDNKIRRNINSADAIVAISQKQIIDGKKLTKKDIQFIPHGISDTFFSDTTQMEEKPFTLKLITVSRLIKLKNIDLVIRSLNKFKYYFILDIYGIGPEMENLRLLINNLGMEDKVNLKGYIPNTDLPKKLKEYNFFIMPSFPESLGRVYFEAMASSLPVIASRNTGIDGLISQGDEGFLINPLDEDNFSNELISLLEKIVANPSELEEMSKKARSFANDYAWDKIIPKYISLYRRTIS